ncbi:hypothetical protein BDY17DRAFT_153367 [Neohortaea acidophila]|uniref:BZIP domain-containing protein n=1 Tax=Neohortaea acidophila TaxID=245834 RepID=A0A6A6PVH5_9PEZI|nr:uncharacterized protein BDY17DRAFT_153367 [Neohortaea acidophila]KAF2483734.1 hypothetical protein BDY17DRAFT_153367 [Neohortaea acidophila]
MTCVLLPPQPFSLMGGWPAMNPTGGSSFQSHSDSQQYGLTMSEPESASSSSNKKRASRAGTRSVSTLSAAQLDRKRANDREAQRAIRQRTKAQIEGLENGINDLRAAKEASEKALAVAQQRNRELEEEVSFLRAKLSQRAGVFAAEAALDSAEVRKSSLRSNSTVHTHVSASSMPVAEVAHAPPTLHLATQQVPHPSHGFWQPSPNELVQVQTAPATIQDAKSAHMVRSLSDWRAHEGVQSAGPHSDVVHDAVQSSVHGTYPSSVANQFSQFATPSIQHAYSGSAMPSRSETTSPQDRQYPQAVQQQMYPSQSALHHHPTYQPTSAPHPPPPSQQQQQQAPTPTQATYQPVDVSAAVGYHAQPQQQQQQSRQPSPQAAAPAPAAQQQQQQQQQPHLYASQPQYAMQMESRQPDPALNYGHPQQPSPHYHHQQHQHHLHQAQMQQHPYSMPHYASG